MGILEVLVLVIALKKVIKWILKEFGSSLQFLLSLQHRKFWPSNVTLEQVVKLAEFQLETFCERKKHAAKAFSNAKIRPLVQSAKKSRLSNAAQQSTKPSHVPKPPRPALIPMLVSAILICVMVQKFSSLEILFSF